MAKVFTQEEREKIKGQVVELVRRSGRETLLADFVEDAGQEPKYHFSVSSPQKK
ncbi:TPA: DUF977 family protein [Escherichia coli]|nr:DUF977 family protein [Escherichia coli]